MNAHLSRQLHVLRIYCAASSLVLVLLSVHAIGGFRLQAEEQATNQTFGEITVGRINVVDADGKLRLVISNKDRQHPGMMDGKLIDRSRPVAGMLFFNEEGDEVGGLTFTGREVNGARQANAGLMFDQFKQDQTIGFTYSEGNGRRSAAFQVWDRPESKLSDLIEKLNAANKIEDRAERERAIAAIRAAAPPAPRRVFVGKTTDRAASVALSDAAGKVRLLLTVDAAGNPRIEFLDDQGKVVSRLPQ